MKEKKHIISKKIFISSICTMTILSMSIPGIAYTTKPNTNYSTLISDNADSEASVLKKPTLSIIPENMNVMDKEKVSVLTPEVDPIKDTDKFVKVKHAHGVDNISVTFPNNLKVTITSNGPNWVIVDGVKVTVIKKEGEKLLIPIPEKVKLMPGDKIVVVNKSGNDESKSVEISVEKEKLEKPIVEDITEGDSIIKIKKPSIGDEISIQFPDKSVLSLLKGQNGWKYIDDTLVETEGEYLLVNVESIKIVSNGSIIVKVTDNGIKESTLTEKKINPKKPIVPEIPKPNAPVINQPYSGDKNITIVLPKKDTINPKSNPKLGDKILLNIINLENHEEKITYEIKENDIKKGIVEIQVPELKKDFDIKVEIMNTEGGKSDEFVIKVINKKIESGNSSSDKKDNSKQLKFSRINGTDRIETAVEVSKKYYNKADSVIIARADIYPDSLTAGVLAKALNAPILLTNPSNLDKRVEDEISRLGVKNVVIIGGKESVSLNTEKLLNKFDKNIERLAGSDRYATSSLVGDKITKLLGKKKTAIIASGETFADALSIGAYASENGYPILLVKKNLVPSKISKSFKDLDIEKVYVIGGNSTIDEKAVKQLPEIKERIFGANRYDTSLMIAKSKFSQSTHAFISSGDIFSDSLVIGAVGGKHHIPVLLTEQSEAKKAADYIKNSMINEFTVIGGKNAVNDEIITKIAKN